MSERQNILRAAGVVSGATMFTRVLGYTRDAIIASYFGTGIYADAFFAAFRVPNLLRRLLGEGALTISFIPIYSELRGKKGDDEARRLYQITFTALIVLLSIIVSFGILFAAFICRVLVPGFGDDPEKARVTILLLRVMFPYAFMVCFVALAMGVLNSWNRFFAPAFAPALLNLGMIVSTVLLVNKFDLPVMALAVGVLFGGVMQVIFQLPFLRQIGHLPRWRVNFSDPNLRRILLLAAPGIIGLSVYTLDVFVNTIFASLLHEGAVSYLFYADRLMELPQGVFAIAVGTALLPSLSRQAANNDMAGLVDSMNYGMRMIIIIILPTAVGLHYLAEPIINVLFQRGKFDWVSTQQTAGALRMYTLGLLCFAALRVVVPVFYAMKDTLTPALVGIMAVTINLATGLLTMGPTVSNRIPWISFISAHYNIGGPMQQRGLALAASVGALFNFTVLATLIRRRIGRLGARKIIKTLFVSSISSAIMGFAVAAIAGKFDFTTSGARLAKVLGLTGAILAGAVTYLIAMFMLNRREMSAILLKMKRKRG